MKLLKKITGSLLAAIVFSLSLAPAVLAQTALDDIKAKLESEGIAVVDYSTPEGQWGSLPSKWVSYLSGLGYTGLGAGDVALVTELEKDFSNISGIKRELAIAEATKSRLTDAAEIEEKNDEIEDIEVDLKIAQDDARDAIANIVAGADNKEEGINLIYAEVDFYVNYNRWGRLPSRIIDLLQEADYESLQDVVDKWEEEDFHPYDFETTLSQIDGISADDAALIIDNIAILSATGEQQITQVARAVTNTIKNIIAGVAVLWIVIAGARMIFAQGDETIITEQKRSIIYGIVGLVAILLVDRGIDFIYGPAGVVRTELTADQGFTAEVYGVINFIKALIGSIAILFIIVSGFRMIFAAGEEQQITKQKTALLWIGVGLILIAIDQVIVENFFIIPVEQSDQIRTSNITSLINTIGTVLQFILGFVGLIAFGALIYGSATMVMNYGNDEMVEKAKKIIRNAIIGILVILSAYTIELFLNVLFRYLQPSRAAINNHT